MSEPSPASEWAPPPRRSFSTLVTVVCSIVAVLYIGLLGRPLIEPRVSPLAELEHPAESLERLVTRELDLRAAMRGGLRWEWRLYRALSGDEDPLAAAGDWYAELVEQTDSPLAELHRAIILAEAGRTTQAREAIAELGAGPGPRDRMAAWATAAYVGPPPAVVAGRALIAEIDDLPATWFTDTLIRRIATRIGDTEARAQAEAATLARGRALLLRARGLMAVSLALLAAGGLALAWMLARRRSVSIANAALPPLWGFADGYALFVRGLGAPQAIALVAFIALRRETGFGTVLGMAADLPLFLWVIHYLRRRDTSMRATFGLVPRRDGWAPLLGATLALIAVALVSDTLIDVASRLLHVKTHWTEGFTEELLWAGRRRVILAAIDATAWAPVVEEILFRGLLYATLRTRIGVAESALLSAVIFTLPHGYAIAGSASVLVSGLLWAVAYERTRSLLPGLFAHAVNNLLSTLWTVGLLR
jgi:membrane protease YdiL (CAAX protease family)